MVLAKQNEGLEAILGAAVYTDTRQLAGFVFEVSNECIGISLCGGVLVWLGKSMIASVEGRGVVLSPNLLRKHHSVHTGIHIHKAACDRAGPAFHNGTYLISQAT